MEQSRRGHEGSLDSLRGKERRGRKRRRPALESLESRRLLASISEFSVIPAENNNPNTVPYAITSAPDGNLWFVDIRWCSRAIE
jgi:hypothetical protein